MLKKIIIILFTLCCSAITFGQIAPVSSRTTFRTPYSALLSEWSDKISLTLFLRDLSVINGRVFVKLRLQSPAISIETQPNFHSQVFQLDGGVPVQINGDELHNLFKPENLMFSGISATEFVRNGSRLPEGVYQLWFEVYEWGSKLKVSAAETPAIISVYDIEPPILNLPQNHSLIFAESPQNLIFSWTPRHLHAISSGFRGIYDFELVQIPDQYTGDLQSLFATTQKDIEKTLFQTQFLYDEFSNALIPNHRYAFRVRVRNMDDNNESFQLKNNGYSEIFTFNFSEKCEKPENLQGVTENPYSANISWTAGDFKNRYLLSYRKTGNDEFSWFTKTSDLSSLSLNDLSPNQTYEVKLKTLCEFTNSDESELILITTPAISDSIIKCGATFKASDTCKKPLETLKTENVFTSNGTTIHLREVSGNNGMFSGKGYVTVPNFQFVKLNVTFENIRINECFEHTDGIIKVVYDETKNLFFDGDAYFEGGDFTAEKQIGDDCSADTTVSFPMSEATSATLSNGDIRIGKGTTTQTFSETDLPITVKDKDGKIFEITPDGKINVLAQPESGNSSPVSKDTLQTFGTVTFAKHPENTTAFDAWNEGYGHSVLVQKHYEKFNGTFIPYQLIEAKKSGVVRAILKSKNDSLNPEKISFKNGKNTVFQAKMIDENTFDVSLIGANDAELQVISATYIHDSTEHILGKLFVPSFKKILHTIKIIPTFVKPFDITNLKTELHTIFKPYLVEPTVCLDSAFLTTAWDLNNNGVLDVVGSNWGSTLTSEMREITQLYKSQREIDPKTIYLFLFEKSPSNTDGISISGDMPRGEQFGYLFSESSETLAKTAAHEICHGVFKLKHTFDNDYQIPKKSTTNLMDYSDGTHLAYWQWLQLQDPPTVWTAFENDADGALIAISDEKVLEVLNTVKNAKTTEKKLSFKNEYAYSAYDLEIGGVKYAKIFVRINGMWNAPIKIKVRKIDTIAQQNTYGRNEYILRVYTEYSEGKNPHIRIVVNSRREQEGLYAYICNIKIENRILWALDSVAKYIGKTYQQETGTLRTGSTPADLDKMDCSEFVCRFLQLACNLNSVPRLTTLDLANSVNSSGMIGNYLQFVFGSEDVSFMDIRPGDIFLWRTANSGHVGIVKSYNEPYVYIMEALTRGSENILNTGACSNCVRHSKYTRTRKALLKHDGWKGYFRPIINN